MVCKKACDSKERATEPIYPYKHRIYVSKKTPILVSFEPFICCIIHSGNIFDTTGCIDCLYAYNVSHIYKNRVT